ncbi:hypothetical protein A8924_6360 [Saccharopolyspora erythraea NRRL 2338]|nr:hypothetical protein A8924_6360 [Saccharopolyspora erythraea NRRL 2338]
MSEGEQVEGKPGEQRRRVPVNPGHLMAAIQIVLSLAQLLQDVLS